MNTCAPCHACRRRVPVGDQLADTIRQHPGRLNVWCPACTTTAPVWAAARTP
jgi:hypothetical protein